MRKKVFLAGVLALSMAVTAVPGAVVSGEEKADDSLMITTSTLE